MSLALTFVSTILSIISAIIGLLVIGPYLLNKFCYKPDLWLYVHSDGHSPPIIPRSGGNIQIAIHAKNKQRVVVESVWHSPSSGKYPSSIEWGGGRPVLLSGDAIPPRTNGAPHSLIAKQQVIGDSDRHVGFVMLYCKVIDDDVSEFVEDITIKAHVHQGDLPYFVDMHTPPTIECIFHQTIQIQE